MSKYKVGDVVCCLKLWKNTTFTIVRVLSNNHSYIVVNCNTNRELHTKYTDSDLMLAVIYNSPLMEALRECV